MFKVDTEGYPGHYKISIGDGKRGGHKAKDLAEVQMALDHHFLSHIVHQDACPLCRAMKS